jgi:hypothetical protein
MAGFIDIKERDTRPTTDRFDAEFALLRAACIAAREETPADHFADPDTNHSASAGA